MYKGVLSDGVVVAVKRSERGSMQGGTEFKTEIELLSRVHHKNLVGLVGFCFDQGEQMLVYEFMANGTLRESLSGRTMQDISQIFTLPWIIKCTEAREYSLRGLEHPLFPAKYLNIYCNTTIILISLVVFSTMRPDLI